MPYSKTKSSCSGCNAGTGAVFQLLRCHPACRSYLPQPLNEYLHTPVLITQPHCGSHTQSPAGNLSVRPRKSIQRYHSLRLAPSAGSLCFVNSAYLLSLIGLQKKHNIKPPPCQVTGDGFVSYSQRNVIVIMQSAHYLWWPAPVCPPLKEWPPPPPPPPL